VVAWQVATLSVVGCWVAAGLALAAPTWPDWPLDQILALCLATLNAAIGVNTVARVVGAAVAVVVSLWAAWGIANAFAHARRLRRRHAELLRFVAQPSPDRDAVLVDDPRPAVYCLPGRVRRVVISRGAIEALDTRQLQAVLAHERAHLSGRHHLVLASLRGLAKAFPFAPVLVQAPAEVGRLLEMCADDAAVRRHGPGAVTGALAALCDAAAPAGSLGAGGSTAADRVTRLADTDRAAARRARRILTVFVLAFAAGPFLVAAAPVMVVAATHLGYCPLPST
jgi:Zn-dependent protease with chaperone function